MGGDRRSARGAHQGGAARFLGFVVAVALAGAACRPGDGPSPGTPASPALAPGPGTRPDAAPPGPRRPGVVLGFARAKKVARDLHRDHRVEAYCACAFDAEGAIDPRSCGYAPRRANERSRRIEWEHVVPARRLGEHLACWQGDTEGCRADRKRGRACCSRSEERGGDPLFHAMEGDLHNLLPAVGELNADRSDRPYGEVAGEPREYGACDFEVDRGAGRGGVTEPPAAVRGDVARIWLYAVDVWGLVLTPEEATTFRAWSAEDPVDSWELERDRRIEAAQGNRNHHVAR